MKMHKICPRCGSKNVNWIIPQNWSQCVCRDCDYTGSIIEGNDDLAREIHKSYIESLKEVKLTYTTPVFNINLNNVDIQRESKKI